MSNENEKRKNDDLKKKSPQKAELDKMGCYYKFHNAYCRYDDYI